MSDKIYDVPAEWAKRAFVDQAKYNEMYARSINDPDGFWAEHGKRVDWIEPFSKVGNWYTSAALGIKVKDATAGYRAYRSTMIESLDMDAINSYGYGFQIEMVYAVLRKGGTVVEVPITFRDRVRGTSKMSLKIVGEGLRLVAWWGFRDRVLHRGRR